MDSIEVTIIVHNARRLRGRKTKRRHKFSVIFGVGQDKFRTTIVYSDTGCPEWMEESTLSITDGSKSTIVFLVTDKDEVQGQVTLPVDSLPFEAHRRRMTFPLQPHKKCLSPSGELTFEAWISNHNGKNGDVMLEKASAINVTSGVSENDNRVKQYASPLSEQTFSQSTTGSETNSTTSEHEPLSDELSQTLDDNVNGTLVEFDRNSENTENKYDNDSTAYPRAKPRMLRRCSASLQDLVSAIKPEVGLKNKKQRPKSSNCLLSLNDDSKLKRYNSSTDIDGNDAKPDIRSVNPGTIYAEGGTRLMLKGFNLGQSKADIVELFVCGANLLSSLEYESSGCIYCTTKPWKLTTGYITIETQSGGRGKSLTKVKFINAPKFENNKIGPSLKNLQENSTNEKNNGTTKDELLTEIKRLQVENAELKEKNNNLTSYIDDLVARVLEACPDALHHHTFIPGDVNNKKCIVCENRR